jgi:hypothetical protein
MKKRPALSDELYQRITKRLDDIEREEDEMDDEDFGALTGRDYLNQLEAVAAEFGVSLEVVKAVEHDRLRRHDQYNGRGRADA